MQGKPLVLLTATLFLMTNQLKLVAVLFCHVGLSSLSSQKSMTSSKATQLCLLFLEHQLALLTHSLGAVLEEWSAKMQYFMLPTQGQISYSKGL